MVGSGLTEVKAVSFDFFNTLVFQREERGRGRTLVAYLEDQGFDRVSWEHQALYDIFERHDFDYDPHLSPEERTAYHNQLALRVFERLNVRAPPGVALDHAEELWRILGPKAFAVFPEVPDVLRVLRQAGFPIAMISNWQRGLRHFVAELGLATEFDHILGSADVGVAKPDGRIFHTAVSRLGVRAKEVVHVGDNLDDDYVGGSRAGLQVVLVDRSGEASSEPQLTIADLTRLPQLLGIPY